MEKFIPFEKLSKKKQRELNAQKRGTWGSFNPVTRKPQSPKAYNRKTARRRIDDFDSEPFLLFHSVSTLSSPLQPASMSRNACSKSSVYHGSATARFSPAYSIRRCVLASNFLPNR